MQFPSVSTPPTCPISTQRKLPRSVFKDITGLSVGMPPQKEKLMTLIRKKEDNLKKIKKRAKVEAYKLKNLLNVATSTLLKNLFKDMSSSAITLMISQLRNSRKAKRDGKWTVEEKSHALFLYETNFQTYRLLRKMISLPSPRTLQSFLSKIPIQPGIDRRLLQHLDQCLDPSDIHDRMCVLMFDEMPIRAHIQYNRYTDQIEGLVDHGNGRRFSSPAKSALVFMAQGIIRKWKQPIAFYFSDGKMSADDLEHMIRDVLDAMQEVNIQVVATVCDLATSHLKALLNMGSSHTNPYFLHNGRKIFTVCDPPHLLKCTRNLFQKYHVQFPSEISGQTQTMTAKWAYVKEAYEVDKSLNFRLMNKIEDVHLQTEQWSSMKVKYAAQVMSHKMASSIFCLVAHNDITSPATGTAAFIEEVDQLFDSFNGTELSAPDDCKKVRCCITDGSLHFSVWIKALKDIAEWKFISDAENQLEEPPVQMGWTHSIKAMVGIWNSLKNQGISCLRPRSFNLDPLQNLFGMIRLGCRANNNPTVTQFINSLKTQIINNLELQNLESLNCEEDDLSVLSNCQALIPHVSDMPTMEPSSDKCSDIKQMDEILKVAEDIAQAVSEGHQEILSVAYVSGLIVKRLLTSHQCDICKNCLISDPTSVHSRFIENKEFTDNLNDLIYPSEELVRKLGDAFTLLEKYLTNAPTGSLQNEAISYLGEKVDFSWISCVAHFEYVKKVIIVVVGQIGIPWYCTDTVRKWKSQ